MPLKSCLKKYNIAETQAKEILELAKKYEDANRGKVTPAKLRRISAFNAVEEYIEHLNDTLKSYGETRVDYKVPEMFTEKNIKKEQESAAEDNKHNNKNFGSREEAEQYLKDHNIKDTFHIAEAGGRHFIHKITKAESSNSKPVTAPTASQLTLSQVKTVQKGLDWYESQSNKAKAKKQLGMAITHTSSAKRITLLMQIERAIENRDKDKNKSKTNIRKTKNSKSTKQSNTNLDKKQLEQINNKKLSEVTAILADMFNQDNQKFFKWLSNHLTKIFKQMELKGFKGTLSVVDELSENIHDEFSNKEGVEGLALDNGDIQVHSDRADKYTVIHELIHQATMHALPGNKAVNKSLKTVLEKVKAYLNDNKNLNPYEQALIDGKINALENTDELLSAAFSSKQFQELLRKVDLQKDNKGLVKTAFDAIVNAVKTLLHIPIEYQNALTDIISHGLTLMKEQAETSNYEQKTQQREALPSIKDTVLKQLENTKDYISDPNTVPGFVKEKFYKIFFPYGLSASELSDKGRAVLREQFGKAQSELNRLSDNIRGFRRAFSKLPTDLQKRLSDAWESTETDKEFREQLESLGMSEENVEIAYHYFVNIHKPFMEAALETLQEMGHDYGRISHYIQHLYTQDKKAQKLLLKYFTQKKPLSGNKKFTKQRLYATMKEVEEMAREDGTKLERAFPNPADSTFAYATQFLKYKAAHGIFNELKEANLLAFIRNEKNIPDGWSSIDDSIFKVMRPVFYTSKKTGETKLSGLIEAGKYYAPDSIAQMINNYLSIGLNNPIANTLRAYNNRLNMIQLGFSVFHGAFEVILNGVNNLTLALTYINAGDLKQAKKYLTKTATFPVSWIGDLKQSKLYKDYILHPEKYKNNQEAKTIIEAFTRANGVLGLEKHYQGFQTKQLDALRTAIADNDILKALPAAIGSVVELAAKPIMEHMVPALKLNAFVQLYQAEVNKLEKLGGKQEDGRPIDYHKIAMNMWDRVDDRFGQMTYDNLFWDKTAKDILHLVTRSVGWNYGDLRELGLSVPDVVRLLVGTYKAKPGEKIETLRRHLTQRILFAGSLFAVTMYAGAIVTYLATGKPPDDLKDLLNPQTNVKDSDDKNLRLALPSYTRDIQAIVNAIMSDHTIHGLTEIVKHKQSPLVNLISEYASNRDYFGNEIVSTTGTAGERAIDRGIFLMRHLTPFTWITTNRLVKKTGSPFMSSVYSLMGLTPAPKYLTQTRLENDIDHFVDLTYGGVRTKEQQEKIKMLSKISADYTRTGKWDNEKIREAVKKGYIKNITRFKMSRMKYTTSVRKFGMLSEDIQVYLYERMSAAERKKYAPKLKKKARKMLLRKGIK